MGITACRLAKRVGTVAAKSGSDPELRADPTSPYKRTESHCPGQWNGRGKVTDLVVAGLEF